MGPPGALREGVTRGTGAEGRGRGHAGCHRWAGGRSAARRTDGRMREERLCGGGPVAARYRGRGTQVQATRRDPVTRGWHSEPSAKARALTSVRGTEAARSQACGAGKTRRLPAGGKRGWVEGTGTARATRRRRRRTLEARPANAARDLVKESNEPRR